MPQCQNHETFFRIALDYGWTLWEYGTDSTCVVGGTAPHMALIWCKPCAWDDGQMIPVGCLCCADLEEALVEWARECQDVIDERRMRIAEVLLQQELAAHGMDAFTVPQRRVEEESTPADEPLAEAPSFLRPYRAR